MRQREVESRESRVESAEPDESPESCDRKSVPAADRSFALVAIASCGHDVRGATSPTIDGQWAVDYQLSTINCLAAAAPGWAGPFPASMFSATASSSIAHSSAKFPLTSP